MKNKFEGTSEIFKDNFKEMQELKPDIKQSSVPVNNFLFSLAFLFFSRNVSVTCKIATLTIKTNHNFSSLP